jgi:ParB-like chromosome segregation protein Spo0J
LARPYAKNARTHTDAQIAAIAASIKEWGWTTPVLVAEGDRPRARRHCASGFLVDVGD